MSHCHDAKQPEIERSLSAEVCAAELLWLCCTQWNICDDIIWDGEVMQACVFTGQSGEYGLESEQVILTPEDENPLRRILQVHTISTIHLTLYF